MIPGSKGAITGKLRSGKPALKKGCKLIHFGRKAVIRCEGRKLKAHNADQCRKDKGPKAYLFSKKCQARPKKWKRKGRR
jgi:hypothetical protein